MKPFFNRGLNTLLVTLTVVLACTNLSTYSDLQKYREIGKELTGEEKPADYFYKRYEEINKRRNDKFENAHAKMYLGIAAHMGYDDAQETLAYYISDRNHLGNQELSDKVKLRWRKRAAQQGTPEAQFNYAQSIACPIGPWERLTLDARAHREAELREAFGWFQKSAGQGYYDAMRQLARWYRKGIGCDKNLEEALTWAKRAYDLQDKRGGNYEYDALPSFFQQICPRAPPRAGSAACRRNESRTLH